MTDTFNAEFGKVDYFDKRGVFFLFFITFFPRLTLLFSSVVSGGLFWWLSWLVCPRLLVALLATQAYFKTNPALVVVSWMVALSGEFFEKYRLGSNKFVFRVHRPTKEAFFRQDQEMKASKNDAIEAEFKVQD
jgi:hypothetical protein